MSALNASLEQHGMATTRNGFIGGMEKLNVLIQTNLQRRERYLMGPNENNPTDETRKAQASAIAFSVTLICVAALAVIFQQVIFILLAAGLSTLAGLATPKLMTWLNTRKVNKPAS